MGKNYLYHSAAELAQDPGFLSWQLTGDPESEAFWHDFVERHPGKAGDVAAAVRIVRSVRMNDCRLSPDEMRAEQRRLVATVARRRRRRRALAAVAAACVVGALAIGGGLLLGPEPESDAVRLARLTTAAAADKVQLVVAGGRSVEIDGDAAVESDATGTLRATGSDGRTLVVGEDRQRGAMNKLIVPRGKRSSVVLPDGSRVWVNAGSTVEFPSRFGAGSREIAVEGEVCVEAAHDSQRPFLVHTGGLTVRVLGTLFNVCAYGDDADRTVALVEGSVDVLLPDGGETVTLRPDEMLVLDDGGPRVGSVDARRIVSWRDGLLDFDGRPLRSILAEVSRYYGVEIECDDTDNNILLSGKLLLFDDMETTLDNITAIAPVAWRVDDGRVVVDRE